MIGKAYVLQYVAGSVPAIIYSRCIDEAYVRAELLNMFHEQQELCVGKSVMALYDLDPSFTVAEFVQSYRGTRRARLNTLRSQLQRNPEQLWPYDEFILPEVPGWSRPAYTLMMQKTGLSGESLELARRLSNDSRPAGN